MSAFGTKQTWVSAPRMSAFGGKADKLCGPLTLGATSIWSRAFGVVRCAVILKVVQDAARKRGCNAVDHFVTSTASLFCVSSYIAAQ